MRSAAKTTALAALLAVGAYFGLGLALLARGSDEQAIISATSDSLRLPRCLVRAYVLHWRTFDPAARSQTGQSLVALTLAGYDSAKAEGAGRSADILDVAAMLVRQGVSIDAADHLGLTALHAAVLADSPDEVGFLLLHGADANAAAGPGKFAGLTPLAMAVDLERRPSGPRRTEVIGLLRAAQAR